MFIIVNKVVGYISEEIQKRLNAFGILEQLLKFKRRVPLFFFFEVVYLVVRF